MSAIYRKYRPQAFAEMIGQNHIKITLQNQISRGGVAHAYLFCGPRGLGKTTAARILAKSINCQNRKDGESEPCNKCDSCLDIINNRSIDIIEIDAASHTGVDNVRENIIENSRFTPSKSKFKVFIIDEVHMLSTAAFNALLKTLEEPPAHVVFVLCTTEIHKLPQTIISRCQRYDFKKIATQDMVDLLAKIAKAEKKKVADDVLRNIVLHSEGCVRDAESLLGKVLPLGDNITMEQAELVLPRADYGAVLEFLGYLAEKNSTAAVEVINRLVEEGVDLQVFADNVIEMLRKALLLEVSPDLSGYGIELDEATAKALESFAANMRLEETVSAIETFVAAAGELKGAMIYQLPLELAAIKFCNGIICKEVDDSGRPCPSLSFRRAETSTKATVVAKPKSEEPAMPKPAAVEPVVEAEESPVNVDLVLEEPAVETEAIAEVPENCVDMATIRQKWSDFAEELLETNFALASLLRISQPQKCENNVLEVAVKSAFYKDRLESSNNKKVIEDAISAIVGAKVTVRGVVKEDLPTPDLKSSGERPVFGTDPALIKPKADVAPIPKPTASADPVAEAMSMF